MHVKPHDEVSSETMVWHCFPVAEISLPKRVFKKPETAAALAKLDADVRSILVAQPEITLVEEP